MRLNGASDERDERDEEQAGSGAGDDQGGGAASDALPDDDEADRPGGYPESDESVGDREEADEEDEDEGYEDDEEDVDPRRGKDPSRSWKSIAKENQRRHERERRELMDALNRALGALGQGGKPEPQVPANPPYSVQQIADAQAEGRHVEALQMQDAVADWRAQRMVTGLQSQNQRQRDMDRYKAYLRDNDLDLMRDGRLADAIQDEADRLMSEIPSLSREEALWTAQRKVEKTMRNGKRQTGDLRTDSRERERARRRETRGSRDATPASESGTAVPRMTQEIRAGLERAGLLGEYDRLRTSKNPRDRALYAKKIQRVSGRLDDVKSQTRR